MSVQRPAGPRPIHPTGTGTRLAPLSALLFLCLTTRAYAHATSLTEPPPLSAYFQLGVEHILGGFDHLVFLLGVVLIATRTRTVLWSVTAFTLAHSITLALAVTGLVSISPRLVEPLIALSIAYVGVENFFARAGEQRHRVAFVFGLVHGLGFAGALQELGLPSDRLAPALALFNLGVESGQLLVLAVLLPALYWLRRKPHGFAVTARALNIGLIALGTIWAIERASSSEPAAAAETAETSPAVSERAAGERPATRSLFEASPPRSEVAKNLCQAIQRLPRERRAACNGNKPGLSLESECTRMLSASLATPALQVNPAAADRCIQAMTDRYAACDFTAQISLPPLAECTGLWSGQLAAGERCRSSLECDQGLHCEGLDPAQAGVCAAPKQAGEACGRSIDPLATYLPSDPAAHRECERACGNGRCQP